MNDTEGVWPSAAEDRERFRTLLLCARRIGVPWMPLELRQLLYQWLTYQRCRACGRWSGDRERAAAADDELRCERCHVVAVCGLRGCDPDPGDDNYPAAYCDGCDTMFCSACMGDDRAQCATCCKTYCSDCEADCMSAYCEECRDRVCEACGYDVCWRDNCNRMVCCAGTRCDTCEHEFCGPFHANHHAPCQYPAVKRKK